MMRLLTCAILFNIATAFAIAQDRSSLSVGQQAPDFSVTDSEGNELKLSQRNADGKHVVLMFSRAHW